MILPLNLLIVVLMLLLSLLYQIILRESFLKGILFLSALEAGMSGLPVVATRCGGVEDYIDGAMGRIVSITDWRGIAQVCNQILDKEKELLINLEGMHLFRGCRRCFMM